MKAQWIISLTVMATTLACSSITVSIDPTAPPASLPTQPANPQATDPATQPTLEPAPSATPGTDAPATEPVSTDFSGSPEIGGCPMFPSDHIWNTRVDGLPLDPNSEAYIEAIGSDTGLHPDFGAEWEGEPIGIPFNIVDGSVAKVGVTFEYADESDAGPYPIPDNPQTEAGSDQHILIVDSSTCTLYEIYAAEQQGDGSWEAGSGAIWDLRDYVLRPDEWTSADAAGLPILPGLVRYDEAASGEIRHAIRFTAENTRSEFIWPAKHEASDDDDPNLPPMGQRFRLKASFDISPYPPEMQVILRAMQTYGLILADNGSDWYINGVPDERWDNDTLVPLFREITGDNFEAVDVSGLMIDPSSGQARQP